MKTQAVVVADDPVYVNWLQNAAGNSTDFSLVRPVDAEDLIERITMMGRVDMVFFQFEPANVESRISMIDRLQERMPDVPVAGVGSDSNPDVVLAAMRAGARDFFVLRRDEANVAALLGKLLRRTTAASAKGQQKQGRLLAVAAANPSESVAFIAEHLALTLVERGNRATDRVLFLDIATPAGAGAIFLNVNQSYSVLDAVNDVYRCDQTLVDTAFTKHASGLYLLSLPEDLIGKPQINVEDLLKLVGVLRGLFACVLVACDGHLPMALLTGLITQADRTLLLSDQSIIKSRHSKYLLRALRLEDCPLDRAGLVVDNYRHRLGLEPENLAEILDLPLAGTLTSTGNSRIQAMNSGESMFTVAPKDPFCADLRRLAEALLSGELKAPPPPAGLLSRLFG